MAKMKIEFLHHWRQKHGLEAKDRLVAYLPRWAPWAARLPWLANARDRIPGAAQFGERWLGLSAKRSLPRFRRDTFLGSEAAKAADAAPADVVLLVDTFTNYYEPENAHAALEVLHAAGYRVRVARPAAGDGKRPLCCGRTFLAAGLVDEARAEARRMLRALAPAPDATAARAPIVGLEPSCLFSLKDEFLSLRLGDDADRVASRALLLEEFLAAEQAAGRLRLDLEPLPQKRALLHGHCHQKAFDAMQATRAALGLVPDLEVEVIETSCCGMAGSFGFEARHYDVSLAMAELALLPAVRKASADTLVVADGTSCRHQIADGAGREARHVARVLADALAH